MAQKTEKEETEFKVPETLTSTSAIGGLSVSSSCSSSQQKKVEILKHGRSRNEIKLEVVRRSEPAGSDPVKKAVNRCNGCSRKVGLTGFRCRCGELFCWEHRYSDRHDCSFDYKTAAREAIARENPVVKAAKIVRV